MDTALPSATLIVWLGFGLGAIFGFVGNKTNFCTMGAVSDIVNMGDWGRMRMWLLAIGVAILGAGALHAAGLIDLGKSIYRTPTFTWLSYILGGLCFGVGMVLACLGPHYRHRSRRGRPGRRGRCGFVGLGGESVAPGDHGHDGEAGNEARKPPRTASSAGRGHRRCGRVPLAPR